jgi:phospholipase/carboxylesterase
MTSRRSFLATSLLAPCVLKGSAEGARLTARPRKGTGSAPGPGLRSLGVRRKRDAQLYVPKLVAQSETAAPFLVYLHGATGSEQQGITKLKDFSDRFGFILLSPASGEGTWDAIRGEYGADVRMLDEALSKSFELCDVDPKQVGLCGFSDGASYALGLGLANGDLFPSLMAFSPGFVPAGFEAEGRPRVFISHGTEDQILPIETCSRVLVPKLKQHGYRVTYREFEGPHTVPRDVCEEALRWFLNLSAG